MRKTRSALDASQTQHSTIRSSLNAGEELSLRAKQDVVVEGGDLSVGKHLRVVGQNITLDPGLDRAQTQQSNQMSQFGVTASVGGYAVDAFKAIEQAENAKAGLDENGNQKKDGGDMRVAALYAAKAALTLYNGIVGDAAANTPAPATPPSNSGTAAIKATVSIGVNSALSQSDTRAAQNQGSTLSAGQNVDLRAIGNGVQDAQVAQPTATSSPPAPRSAAPSPPMPESHEPSAIATWIAA